MKLIWRAKVTTLLMSGLLVGLMVCWAQAQTAKKTTPTPTPEKKIKIADTIARREGKNKVVFKSEFEAVKQSDNSAVVRKKSVGTKTAPGVEGKVRCFCEKGGICVLTIKGTDASCTGNCDCQLSIETK